MKFPSTSLAILSSVTLSLAYNGPFRLVVGNANPDLHLKPITANDHQLEINGETTSYGSFDSVKLCPPGNEITFRGGDGSLSMNVAVSGGQFVYVESEGMLKFTQAHSAIMPPLNSIMGGWHRCAPVNYGFGKFTWSDSKGSGGFVVCGVEPVGAWEVYALMAGIPQPACETIGLLISKDDFEISGVSAWEYE